MPPFSVITLVKGRKKQLENLLESIGRSTVKPQEVVVVWMEEDRLDKDEIQDVPIHQVTCEGDGLPLAKARNLGVDTATQPILLFLDVDCICSPNLFDALLQQASPHTISSAGVRYLPDVPEHGNYDRLSSDAIAHPKRANLPVGTPIDHKHFWSLVFCIHRNTFNEAGGFDDNFTGYGGEDTDFAERFTNKGCKLVMCDAEVLHQYHTKYTPPMNYVASICENANYFAQQHGYLPMYSWLKAFEEKQLISLDEEAHQVALLREPSEQELTQAFSEQPY